MHFERPPLAVLVEDHRVELRAAGDRRYIVGANVGERGEAVRDDPPVANAADDVLHFGMIDAEDREPEKGTFSMNSTNASFTRSKLP